VAAAAPGALGSRQPGAAGSVSPRLGTSARGGQGRLSSAGKRNRAKQRRASAATWGGTGISRTVALSGEYLISVEWSRSNKIPYISALFV